MEPKDKRPPKPAHEDVPEKLDTSHKALVERLMRHKGLTRAEANQMIEDW